jgi:hypothetical protein
MSIDWKRYAITGASFGVALAVALIAAAGLFYWYSSRPPSWDSSSVKGISTTVSQTFNLDEQQKQFTASGFTMAFVRRLELPIEQIAPVQRTSRSRCEYECFSRRLFLQFENLVRNRV